jgi:hypothetical protein
MNESIKAFFDSDLNDYRDMFYSDTIDLNECSDEELSAHLKEADEIMRRAQTRIAAIRTIRRVRGDSNWKGIDPSPSELRAAEKAKSHLSNEHRVNLLTPKEELYEKMVKKLVSNGMEQEEAEKIAKLSLV